MAVAAYYSWDRLGRPLDPARPIRELVEGLRVAFPRAAGIFSWYANDAHYQSSYPQDHTPFSVTGWPLASPQWWVFATDVMHRPDLGVDCDKLFPYWLTEARAGRMPWLKYLIYKATVYDVRYGWRPQSSSGHDKHIHLSARTDHRNTSLGDWSVNGDDVSWTDKLGPTGSTKGRWPKSGYEDTAAGWLMRAAMYAWDTQARVDALAGVIQALADALKAGGGSVDTAAILAGVDERLAAHRAQVEADTRDAIADLAEGGADAVRADSE